MASIDKTYTDSYKEYKEFKDWADKQELTFFDGYTVCIGDWVWHYEEKDFNNGEIPIMNTPTWLDIYLIQNCKSKFVLDRMKVVYGETEFERLKTINLTTRPPKEYQQNRKITIKKIPKQTKFPIHNKPYYKKSKWWLQCNDIKFGYNEYSKTWANSDYYYPTNTNTAEVKSLKGIVRQLRKQYLPKGLTFTISGMYVVEDYTAYVS